ncbi:MULTISPECIES: hypothetical protein [unclassified Streptomyces]|uniref:hypothetical protein n=1 Tax=unclassified Streptomyces TaxID=2593676 RepID=UPI002E822EC6|nr:hypothetical protein [Streptomyces sp. NBC_00589]WTI36186.1 hypothetical protein OIC96_14860 [Streptomyces sp. NBC_00775]WUB30139.1 hypothetical protein OHA51_34870 [Streptomyces sp. NBC_00589]
MRIVLCLLLAVDTGEPIRLFHGPQGTAAPTHSTRAFSLAGALATRRGIVKRVLLTSAGHFSEPENHHLATKTNAKQTAAERRRPTQTDADEDETKRMEHA